MVKKHHLLITVIAIFVFMMFLGVARAQQRRYRINQEGVKIWVNKDGTIDLFYNISITLESGNSIKVVSIGQPQRNFNMTNATDQNGHTLAVVDASYGDYYAVNVTLQSPLLAGQTIWFTLTTRVAHIIWEDTLNPGNAGMLFNATWWTEASVFDLRILVVLPSGITEEMVRNGTVKTLERAPWDGVQPEDDGVAIYWERQNLLPNERFGVGVSFPKQYVQYYDTQPTGLVAFFQRYGTVLFAFAFVTFIVGSVLIIVRKKSYLLPKISMETLGIRRGLTAVEASYLLGMQPTKIVTEILYSVLQKRAIWVESTNPSLKLKVMQPFQDKHGTSETPLRYYEMDFLKALKEDRALEEEKLAHTIMFLRDAVEQKMQGYCRRDTIDYYTKIVAKAWEQVQQAGTSELASKAYDEQLLWLLLDPNVQSRTETAFRDRAFEPSPFWLWYWYGYQHYDPHPTYKPNVEIPTQSAKPPTVPGADFANNIATAVEKTSNNIVVNLERFANAILPMPEAKASSEPARHGATCVCACASCACVCACVSCACACASGGVG